MLQADNCGFQGDVEKQFFRKGLKGEKMEIIKLKDEFIKLGQALKAANLVEDGVEAKYVIQDGEVKVNQETETRRGRKLYDGDVVSYNGEEIRIEK